MAMKKFRLLLNAIVLLTFIAVSQAQVRTSGSAVRSGSESGVRANNDSNIRSSTPRNSIKNSSAVRPNNNANQTRGNSPAARNQSNNRINSSSTSVRSNNQGVRSHQNSVRSNSNNSNNREVREVKVENLPQARNFNRSDIRVENGKNFSADRMIYHPNSNA